MADSGSVLHTTTGPRRAGSSGSGSGCSRIPFQLFTAVRAKLDQGRRDTYTTTHLRGTLTRVGWLHGGAEAGQIYVSRVKAAPGGGGSSRLKHLRPSPLLSASLDQLTWTIEPGAEPQGPQNPPEPQQLQSDPAASQ